MENRIDEWRKARNLTYEEVAERADLSPSYVSRMAHGERNISLKILEKLAGALGCRPEDLLVTGSAVPEAPNPTPDPNEIDPLFVAAWKRLTRKQRKQLVQFALIMAGDGGQ